MILNVTLVVDNPTRFDCYRTHSGRWTVGHRSRSPIRGEAAANDWYGNAGRSVGQFEAEFARYLGVEHAAAVPHGTSGLHLAMLALDIGPGDEVIVPESTWVATAAPIVYAGATPVFADIDPTAGASRLTLSNSASVHEPRRSSRSTSTAVFRTWTQSAPSRPAFR